MTLIIGGGRFLEYKLRFRIAVRHLARGRAVRQRDLIILREKLPELDAALKEASQLPLKDAAALLWRRKQRLDREQSPPKSKKKAVNLADQEIFKHVVNKAIAQVILERDNAHRGPTFGRLKMAHPKSKNQDIQIAIKAAIQFEKDCLQNFSKLNADGIWDVDRALNMARLENPGYLESTYEQQRTDLRIALR